MPVIKITQRSIESLECRGSPKTDYFDSETKGLMIQVRSSGRKTFYYRERDAQGKTVQTKIGDAETIRLAMVRRLIEERKKQVLQQTLNRVSQAWGIESGGLELGTWGVKGGGGGDWGWAGLGGGCGILTRV